MAGRKLKWTRRAVERLIDQNKIMSRTDLQRLNPSAYYRARKKGWLIDRFPLKKEMEFQIKEHEWDMHDFIRLKPRWYDQAVHRGWVEDWFDDSGEPIEP